MTHLYQHLGDAHDRSQILKDILEENGTLNYKFICTVEAKLHMPLYLCHRRFRTQL